MTNRFDFNAARTNFASAVVILIWGLIGLVGAGRAAPVATTSDFFEQKIRPVLVEHCYECHSGTSPQLKGGLRVDSLAGMMAGGERGSALAVGQPEASRLWIAISHQDEKVSMPFKKAKLSDAVVKDFERWIREGAVWPRSDRADASTLLLPSVSVPLVAPGLGKSGGFDLSERKERLAWIWETPRRQIVPTVKDIAWPQDTVDRFILGRLEKEGLKPAPAAEPATWLRRVHFALVGLPPSPAEVAEFLSDGAQGARARVVDQLLASPHFGERWGRHWLDLVRYAESRGHESDFIIPNAYEYRDYVIRALNADLPYNDFVQEHLAGDLLSPPRRHPTQGFNESILGTGWALLGEEIHAPVDTRQDENERIDNRIDVFSKTFLGLTLACARCHDHKFDAISQRDYYAMAGFFISSGQRLARFETMETEHAVAEQLENLRSRRSAELSAAMVAAQQPVLGRLREFLTAAVEVATTATTATNGTAPVGTRLRLAEFSPSLLQALGRISVRDRLDPIVLGQWTAAVVSAVNDPEDVLFRLVEVAGLTGSAPQPPKDPGGDLGLPEGGRTLVDFGEVTSKEWYADGVAFGLRPRRAGDWQITAPWGTNGASVRVATRGAAQSDSDWRDLDLSPGVEREPTLYGGWKRDGVMVRSSKFELTNGHLYYLVRGSGRVLAAVDSQRLVTGPVHTGLVYEWGFEDRWHWVSQDLSDYSGHRVALEFSPGPEFDTAIALVVESERPPGHLRSVADRLRHREQPAISLAATVAVYQRCFEAAANGAATNQPGGLTYPMRNWLAQRPELFSGREGDWPEPMASAIQGYLRERQTLFAGVKWKSHTAPALMEGNGVDEYLLSRGKHQTPKGRVPRRILEAIGGSTPIPSACGSGRRELAKAMIDPSNPLVARVLVNRVWHQLFGRGLVATVDNFGWLGQRPSHPELLDELAATFVHEEGWSIKQLIRRLALSRTYAMSSQPNDAVAEERDPENLWLHRMNLKRLEGEVIRDAMLAVSGRLNRQMYGASVPLHPSQFFEARGLRNERGPLDGGGRRSLYVASRRNFLPMMMTAFDTPIPFTTVGRRNVSNVPGQMLFLMNDPLVHEQAAVWARRLLAELPEASETDRIRRLFLTAFGREPGPGELDRCGATLRDVRGAANETKPAVDPWTELCHALLGVKEFIYVR